MTQDEVSTDVVTRYNRLYTSKMMAVDNRYEFFSLRMPFLL